MWRQHNTEEAMRDFLPCLCNFRDHRDVNKLRYDIFQVYKQKHKNFYFTGGGRPEIRWPPRDQWRLVARQSLA